MRDRTFLGHAPVYAGDDGQLLVDTDAVSGDFGYEDDDDFGYEDDDIEVGAPAFIERSRERRANRKKRRANRKRKRADKLDTKAGKLRSRNSPQPQHQDEEDWVGTVLSGSQDLTAAGAWTVTMRPQHDFRAKDISFPGSTSGCDVTAVYFGDRPVWQSTEGVDVSFFASTGFIRNILDGQEIRAGLDIKVTGTLPGEGSAKVVIVGEKPFVSSC